MVPRLHDRTPLAYGLGVILLPAIVFDSPSHRLGVHNMLPTVTLVQSLPSKRKRCAIYDIIVQTTSTSGHI